MNAGTRLDLAGAAGNEATAGSAARGRVLCVDDDALLLEGLKRQLRRVVEVETAIGPAEGLAALQQRGPFAVVLSDLGMPGMDGAEFLRRAREIAPETVRMLLTGQSEIESAVAAVNEGQIFRFLLKPCRPPVLIDAFQKALEHHRLITAERVLLEQTLRGCVNALMDVLAVSQPLAFGQACRIRQHVRRMLHALHMDHCWQIELAAMLSQIGSLILPPQTVERLYYGSPLTTAEQDMVRRVPQAAERLLGAIPRLEDVRAILLHQGERFDELSLNASLPGVVQFGASLLRLVVDFDVLESQGFTRDAALDELRQRTGCYDPKSLDAFEHSLRESPQPQAEERAPSSLRAGQIFAEDVHSTQGALLFARGHEISATVCERIANLPPGTLSATVHVYSQA